mgnify:CR=1 FL=1
MLAKITVERGEEISSGMSSGAILAIFFTVLVLGCSVTIYVYIKKRLEENSRIILTETEQRYLELVKIKKLIR